jgi:hypothetical protein
MSAFDHLYLPVRQPLCFLTFLSVYLSVYLPVFFPACQARGKFIINSDIMQQMRSDAVVLHPLPRVDEV